VRRAVGFKLYTVEKYLWSYANFATARGDIRVLSTTAVEWAALASSENQRAHRLKVLIRFARFARAENSGHEIPPDNIFCSRCNRRTPYIFTDEEVKQLILHATRLGPLDSLKPHIYSTLFGLLASTGLRISEALSLRFQDVTAEGLNIRETKFRKSRLVSLHETVVVALQNYLLRRSKFASIDDHLFVSRRGGKLCYAIAAETFQEVLKATGIQGRPGGPKPRLHDFRQNAEARKMPNRNLKTYRKILEDRCLTMSSVLATRHYFSMFGSCLYSAFKNSSSVSLGRNRACLPVSGLVLASAASFSARWACK
jgi:integrase/recombinase XerD